MPKRKNLQLDEVPKRVCRPACALLRLPMEALAPHLTVRDANALLRTCTARPGNMRCVARRMGLDDEDQLRARMLLLKGYPEGDEVEIGSPYRLRGVYVDDADDTYQVYNDRGQCWYVDAGTRSSWGAVSFFGRTIRTWERFKHASTYPGSGRYMTLMTERVLLDAREDEVLTRVRRDMLDMCVSSTPGLVYYIGGGELFRYDKGAMSNFRFSWRDHFYFYRMRAFDGFLLVLCYGSHGGVVMRVDDETGEVQTNVIDLDCKASSVSLITSSGLAVIHTPSEYVSVDLMKGKELRRAPVDGMYRFQCPMAWNDMLPADSCMGDVIMCHSACRWVDARTLEMGETRTSNVTRVVTGRRTSVALARDGRVIVLPRVSSDALPGEFVPSGESHFHFDPV